MALNFTFAIKNTLLETTPNDYNITIVSYLADANGFAFLNSQNQLDTFDVLTNSSALPATGIDSYLTIVAAKVIGDKYNQPDQTIGGDVRNGSDIISNVAGLSETQVLVPGLTVKGENIPDDTTIVRFRDNNSMQISNAATGTGNSTLTFSIGGWKIDYTAIADLTSLIDFTLL